MKYYVSYDVLGSEGTEPFASLAGARSARDRDYWRLKELGLNVHRGNRLTLEGNKLFILIVDGLLPRKFQLHSKAVLVKRKRS